MKYANVTSVIYNPFINWCNWQNMWKNKQKGCTFSVLCTTVLCTKIYNVYSTVYPEKQCVDISNHIASSISKTGYN